jgi:integrase
MTFQDPAPRALTVQEYGSEWLERRRDLRSGKTEATHLRLHVLPVIGHLDLASVRPRHVRDLIGHLRDKVGTAPKCKGRTLAPRTVRHVFATLRLLFKSAVIDEHIAATPVVVERGVLPKNVDNVLSWRSTAIFSRRELVALLTDSRIALYRRVLYALQGLAGLRHGEAAGLQWADYDTTSRPLGRLLIARAGDRASTKTQIAREIPVHPALRAILSDWRQQWAAKYGRPPAMSDLVVPTETHHVRKAPNTLKAFRDDLHTLGLRPRRSHDLRRTFITLAQVDGASRDVLRPMTHPGKQDIVDLYTTLPWPIRCAAIAKLRVDTPAAAHNGGNAATARRTCSRRKPALGRPSRTVVGSPASRGAGAKQLKRQQHRTADRGLRVRKP